MCISSEYEAAVVGKDARMRSLHGHSMNERVPNEDNDDEGYKLQPRSTTALPPQL